MERSKDINLIKLYEYLTQTCSLLEVFYIDMRVVKVWLLYEFVHDTIQCISFKEFTDLFVRMVLI